MRIALVVYGSLERRSGGNLYDQQLVDWLTERGHDVREVPLDHGSYLRHLGHNLEGAWVERLAAEQWDLILQDELVHPSLFRLNRKLRRRTSVPIVSIVHHLRSSEPHHPIPLRPLYRAVERRYLETIDTFVYNSRSTRMEVEGLLGRVTRGMVAHPGGDRLGPPLDEATVVTRAFEPGPLRLVFVGNLISRKNLGSLLRALARISCEWTLDVIGSLEVDPVHAQRMQTLVRDLGLIERVEFTGTLDDRALRQRLARAQLLAVPSTWEGFGIVYLEGMGFGLPAVASTAGAAGEIVREGMTGYLIDPRDVTTASRRIAELAENRTRLAEMSVAALHSFLARPGWREMAATVEAYLLDVWTERRAERRQRAAEVSAR